jgi:hypothetical protein
VCGFLPAHFTRRWNCYAIPLSRRSKRRIQPERYAQYALIFFGNFNGKINVIKNMKNNVLEYGHKIYWIK